jgi:DNA-binding NarL/FixJ family response regulator
MADQLFISEATVKRGVQQLLERLHAHNRSEAVSEAHRRGLL